MVKGVRVALVQLKMRITTMAVGVGTQGNNNGVSFAVPPTAAADTMNGLGGNDTIKGLAGDDTLYGDSGNDRLLGDAGNDYLEGGDGDDEIQGVDGDDIEYGGAGNDKIGAGLAADVLAQKDNIGVFGTRRTDFTGLRAI